MNTSILRNDLVKMKHQRVRYFAGQFLEDKDFEIEQQYHLLRRRRLNKQQFTAGVREGFFVEAVGAILRIGTGFAIDAEGRELWLDEVHVLTAEQVGNGNYFLYMQATEIVEGYTTYALPEDAARGKDVPSSWEGNTRYTDAIRFSLVSAGESGEAHSARIKLASIKCANGKFDTVNSKDRTVSTISLGNGLTVNAPDGKLTINAPNGEPNGYIHVADSLTFSSMSKRMDFTAEASLYMFNRDGVVISNEKFPKAPDAGRLHVQGKAHLQGGASVSHLEGDETLRINNQKGVVIVKNEKDGEPKQTGDLRVEGTLTVEKELVVPGGATFSSLEGKMHLNGGKNDMHISGDHTLYLLTKGPVVVSNYLGGAGNLIVQGTATVNELVVHGSMRLNGTASVNDLKVTGLVTDIMVHSSGAHQNKDPYPDWVQQKLAKNGAFVFFVETGIDDKKTKLGEGHLLVYWKINNEIRRGVITGQVMNR